MEKTDAHGQAPIYVRIKIDGEEDEVSLACKTKEGEWSAETRWVLPSHPQAKTVNKKIERRSLISIAILTWYRRSID